MSGVGIERLRFVLLPFEGGRWVARWAPRGARRLVVVSGGVGGRVVWFIDSRPGDGYEAGPYLLAEQFDYDLFVFI